MMLRLVAVLLSFAVIGSIAAAPPDDIDAIVGTWAGEIEHGGETAPIGMQFERRGDEVRATIIIPAFHGRAGLGPAKMNGNRITVGELALDFDPVSRTLDSTFAPGIVPRYQPHMRLKRVDSFDLPPRAEPTAPKRAPTWTLDLGAPIWAASVYRNGTVFVGADDGRLHAVEAKSGRERWSFKAGGAIRAPVAFVDGTVDDSIVVADDGVVCRVRPNGTERWRATISDAPIRRLPIADRNSRYENRAPGAAVSSGRVYAAAGPRLVALDSSDGRRLWEFRAADNIATTPTVSGGRVFVGSFDRHVYALDASDGAVLWKYDTGDAATSDVAVAGARIIIGSRSYDLEALEAASGALAWKKYFWFSWVESSPVVFDGTIYVGSSDAAKVFAIDPSSGRSIWEADALGSAWGTPVVTRDAVYEGAAGVAPYVAPHRGVVLALERRTGRLLWWHEASPPATAAERTAYGFAASMTAGGGMVFGGALDGKLYAFAQ